ncbi:ATP/GTP-binding protein [Streptomyces sp. AC602_WCS936]|uniref:ATP/GTP-binding protein n=1 Tax=Streptomyces sp. AC602_WCS936 TaxID=2823685 RepID=UPI001C258E1A|nr:ATP/GTP-binding protein [Streptomyces sp. AC602_WCS936]
MAEGRPSLGGRVAARWSRAETTVTKGLLLAVFCVGLLAQFVKPVGDALQGKTYIGGALLSIVGYVLYAEVLRLNTAHDAQREGTRQLHETVRRLSDEVRELTARLRPQSGEEATADRLLQECAQALRRGGEIELWGMCFTGETFVEPLRRVLEDLPPDPSRSVSVRVLVPDFTRPIEVPGLVRLADGRLADAPGFRRHLVETITGYERGLRTMRGRMARKAQGALSVEFRTVHMSPFLKLYVVGDEVVYEGIYDKLDVRPDEYRGPVPPDPETDGDQLLDLIGHGSLLTRWSRYDGELGREVVARRRAFFGTLWDAAAPLEARSARGGSGA